MGCDAVFDSVFRTNPETKEVFSWILEDWRWEDDVTMVMKLRNDIVFSNGEKATAEDLLFSYRNHIDRGSNYLNDFKIIWEDSKVVDDYTVSFKLEQPYPLFPKTTIYLVDKSSSEERGWDSMLWYTEPISSGPYKVKEYVTDDYFVLEARDDYWLSKEVGPTYVDEWKIKYYGDDATLYMALETGDVDLAVVSAANYGRYETSGDNGDGYTVAKFPDGALLTFFFSWEDSIKGPDGKSIWFDKRLREAFAIGIDWKQVGENALGSLYMEAKGFGPESSPDFVNTGLYTFDQERAKQLLAEAGYGPDNPLTIHTSTMDNQMLHDAYETFEFYASQIGIKATFEFKDVSAALGDWLNPSNIDYGFWWAVSGSPTSEIRASFSDAYELDGVRYVFIDDDKFQTEFGRLFVESDPVVAHEVAQSVQQYLHDNILCIPAAEVSTACGWRNDKFTEAQIRKVRVSNDNYQLSRLGLLSSWE
jgi:peptide/nickel transport system substrate-binding protein